MMSRESMPRRAALRCEWSFVSMLRVIVLVPCLLLLMGVWGCAPDTGKKGEGKVAEGPPGAGSASVPRSAEGTYAKVLSAPSAGHLMLRAKDRLSSGRTKLALQLFEQAQKAGSTSPEIHYYLGRCHQELGSPDKMRKAYQEYLRLTPNKESERAREVGALIASPTAHQPAKKAEAPAKP